LRDKVDVTVRGGVGPNAGHTVTYQGKVYKLRLVPSGFINPNTRLYIGAGVAIDVQVLFKEIDELNVRDRIWVDAQSTIIEEHHKNQDISDSHLRSVVQTTGSGSGPAISDRARRVAKLAKDIPELSLLIEDVAGKVNEAIDNKEKVIIEGTQGTFLSVYHGTYPYVTSKDVTASAICSDVGIGPKKVSDVIVVFKSYLTRVGAGPLEGELSVDEIKKLGWIEYGTVTGRLRRAAPFNFKLAKRAVMLNSATQIAITKLDVLYPKTAGIRRYDELPDDARKFIEEIEAYTEVPVSLIGTGSDVYDIIDRRAELGLI
jgi:adenylosuccinate synthase